MSTVAVSPSEVKPGSVAWCSNARRHLAVRRPAARPTAGRRAGSRGCAAGDCSECAMPCPAVISASSPGAEDDVAAERVAVVHLALEQPGHRLQPGVRVRRHLHARRPRRRRPGRSGRRTPRRRPSAGPSVGSSRRTLRALAEQHLLAGQQVQRRAGRRRPPARPARGRAGGGRGCSSGSPSWRGQASGVLPSLAPHVAVRDDAGPGLLPGSSRAGRPGSR